MEGEGKELRRSRGRGGEEKEGARGGEEGRRKGEGREEEERGRGKVVGYINLSVLLYECLLQLNIPKKQSMPPPKAHFQGRNPYPLACADEWELSPSNVIIEARLGEDMFGEVYRGRVQGVKDTGPKTVAIKMLKGILCSGHDVVCINR